jgi:iron-sulfur cluster assembly accessory protein
MRGSAMIQVTLTETAANKVKELIQRSDPETGQPLGSIEDTYLRMYVAGGGCSGFRYGLALDRKIHEDDEVVQVHGLKVLVDGNSKEYLDGSSVDYAESVAGSGFLVSNPNNWSTCGCGQSFNPKGEEAPDQQHQSAHAHTH